jgi:salicylate hydroxylase
MSTILKPCTMGATANPIESAAVFATLFSYLRSSDQIPIFLRAYQNLRQSRAEELQRSQAQTCDVFMLPRGPQRDKRNAELSEAMEMKKKGWDNVSLLKQWAEVCHVWTYNAIDAADDWWQQWGLLRERALSMSGGVHANDIKFDDLQVGVQP